MFFYNKEVVIVLDSDWRWQNKQGFKQNLNRKHNEKEGKEHEKESRNEIGTYGSDGCRSINRMWE